MKLSIALLYGGNSSEREISIKTGNAIANSLKNQGHHVHLFDAKPGFEEELRKIEIDLAVIALHGSPGEDGIIQGMLEFMEIPYTGTGVTGSSLAMNKLLSKRLFSQAKINTPEFTYVDENEMNVKNIDNITIYVREKIGFPNVIKPISEGSSVGLRIPKTEEEFKRDIELSIIEKKPFIIEEFIEGRELTVGILGNPGSALPIIEIKPKDGVYDFKAKYTVGETDFIVPAIIDSKTTKYIQKMAMDSFKLLHCKDFGRVDFILSNKNIPYVLEINTIPGMTETSLLPKAAASMGMGFDELCDVLIKLALKK